MKAQDLSLKTIINNYSMTHLKRKELLLPSNNLIGKIPDPRNAKEHQSFIRKTQNQWNSR